MISSICRRLILAAPLSSLVASAKAQQRPAPSAAAPEPAPADENDKRGPFGLTWGMSSEETKAQGATLRPLDDRGQWGTSFNATGVERILSDTETLILSYGFGDKLFRAVAVGRTNGPDPSGSVTLARYRELVEALSGRYGRGNERDIRDTQMWKGPNEYVMSLSQGRAHRYTNFSNRATQVEISMRGQSNDKSYYLIIFESVPGMAEFERDKKRRERDSL